MTTLQERLLSTDFMDSGCFLCNLKYIIGNVVGMLDSCKHMGIDRESDYAAWCCMLWILMQALLSWPAMRLCVTDFFSKLIRRLLLEEDEVIHNLHGYMSCSHLQAVLQETANIQTAGTFKPSQQSSSLHCGYRKSLLQTHNSDLSDIH